MYKKTEKAYRFAPVRERIFGTRWPRWRGRPSVPYSTDWDNERYFVKLNPEDALPGKTDIKAKVRLTFSESHNQRDWRPVMDENNRLYQETKEVTFRTGDRPQTISMNHVTYAYPVPEQQYFLPREHPTGFIRLSVGYDYLFTEPTTTVRGRFRSGAETIWVDIAWHATDRTITWNTPTLRNNVAYTFELVGISAEQTAAGGVQATYAQATVEGAGESSAEMLTNVAGEAGSEGELVILSYNFRTSRFNTFGEKMGQVVITRTTTSTLSTNGYITAIRGTMSTLEGFDAPDLVGTEYTQNKPLIIVHSAMTDNHYLNAIKPLLYPDHSFGGMVRYSREIHQSVIPHWAIEKRDNYDYGTIALFPWNHFLTNVYYQDYRTARTQIAASSVAQNMYGYMLTTDFPILFGHSSYNLNFVYTLPNGTITNSSIVKTFNVLNF